MFFRDTFNTLVKLYSEGAIDICTPCNTIGNDSPENSQPLLARTIVQPDADIIMYVSEEIVVRPDIWQEHLEKIEDKLGWIRRLRRFLRWTRLLSPVFLLCGGGFRFLSGQITWSILFLLLTLFFALVKPLIGFWFKQRLRREIKGAW